MKPQYCHIGAIKFSRPDRTLEVSKNTLTIQVTYIYRPKKIERDEPLPEKSYVVRFEQVSRFRVVPDWWAITVGNVPDEPHEKVFHHVDRLLDNRYLSDNREIDLNHSYFVDHDAELKHYQVCGEFLWVDVLCPNPPIIEQI